MAWPTSCWRACAQLGGLNEPHLLFGGKIAAQAYDNAAFKVAADELVLSSGAQLLFHAQAVGVVMNVRRSDIGALLIETKLRPACGAGAYVHRLFGRRRPGGACRRAV
jgi:hypothetical protein